VHKLIPAGLPLIETILRVGEQGGFCLAPHPMASGMSMKSLSAFSIRQALRNQQTARILIGIETYNATTLDREGNVAARILAERSGVSQTGSSDAHVLEAIGLGATIFPGRTISDLIAALWTGTTSVQKGAEWGRVRVLSKWFADYLISVPGHLNSSMAH
jgi:predicted metal-dependent phosphoesterase TrpH